MKWNYTFGALILLPITFSSLFTVEWGNLPSQQWAGLAYVLFFGTFFSYLLAPLGQKHLRPTVVAMYNYLQPIAAAVVAILWGLDSFNMFKLAAVLMIFSGVMLVNKSRAKESAPSMR